MMLPKELDPVKAAKAGQVFEGELEFSSLMRLHDVAKLGSNIHYTWSFFVNEKTEKCAELDLTGQFELTCQRCGKSMPFVLDANIPMQVVSTEEEAENLPLETQPLMMGPEHLCDTEEILEEELILSLPMIPMHEEKDCSFSQNEAYYAVKTETNTHKPFANLGKVMNSKE